MGSSSQTSTRTTEVLDTDNLNLQDIDAPVALQGGVINIQDGGAIDAAFDFGREALDAAGDSFDFSSGVVSDAFSGIAQITEQIGRAARSDNSETFQTLAKFGALAAIGIVGLMVWGKRA